MLDHLLHSIRLTRRAWNHTAPMDWVSVLLVAGPQFALETFDR